MGNARDAAHRRIAIARKLRRDTTDVDLLAHLESQSSAWKFCRQHPIGPFIADFACPARKLVIELDGGRQATQQAADAALSAENRAMGYRVIRFWNNEVLENPDGVFHVVFAAWGPPHLTPALSAPNGAEREIGPAACDV